jgi:hypothetical protein
MQLFSMWPGLSVHPIVYAPVLSGAVLMFKACEPATAIRSKAHLHIYHLLLLENLRISEDSLMTLYC